MDSWKDPTLCDAELSNEGIEQALTSDAKQQLASMKLDYVIVSPMKRAIQTAYYLLKDHPDFN